MADAPAPAELTAAQAAETMRSRPYIGLLVVSAVIGVIVSLAAWCYLESVVAAEPATPEFGAAVPCIAPEIPLRSGGVRSGLAARSASCLA